jgi:hypothetical protein
MTNKRKNALTINSITGLLLFILLYCSADSSAGTYLSTKHGDSTDGVNRSVVTSTAYPDATNTYPTGHCGHCHESHASVGGSEPTLPAAQDPSSYDLFADNYGADTNDLCYACHEQLTIGSMTTTYGEYGIYQGQTKYYASIHGSSASMNWSPDASPPGPPFGPNSTLTDDGNCHNCHNPHGYDDGSGLVPYMLFARDSKDGDSPDYEMGCEACHDGSQATEDVVAQLNKTYAHPTHDYNDRHTLPETGESESGTSFGNPSSSWDQRHAECVDCHNPHTVLSGTHTAKTDGNAVSNVLKYVWGVEPSWPSKWTQPTTFTVRKPPTYTDGALYEYQICFKCHSYYGLGTLSDPGANFNGPSGSEITDQAWEFNTNNLSAHPAVAGLTSYNGALDSTQLSATWSSPGTQKMYCSDCHGANDEASAAKGPHGSTNLYMLKGIATATATYWPLNPAGNLWGLNQLASSESEYRSTWRSELFCVNCHPICDSTCADGDWDNNAHDKHYDRQSDFPSGDSRCVHCHVAIPHGSQRSRLIGYSSDPAPYDYGNNQNIINGFKINADPLNYDKPNCYSTDSNCVDKHPNDGGYDP